MGDTPDRPDITDRSNIPRSELDKPVKDKQYKAPEDEADSEEREDVELPESSDKGVVAEGKPTLGPDTAPVKDKQYKAPEDEVDSEEREDVELPESSDKGVVAEGKPTLGPDIAPVKDKQYKAPEDEADSEEREDVELPESSDKGVSPADNITATGIVSEISNEEENERAATEQDTEQVKEAAKNSATITALGNAEKNKLKPKVTVGGDPPSPKVAVGGEPEDIEALGTSKDSENTLGTKGDNESKPGEKSDNEKWQTSWYNLGKMGIAPALDLATRGVVKSIPTAVNVVKSPFQLVGGAVMSLAPKKEWRESGHEMLGNGLDGLTLGLGKKGVELGKAIRDRGLGGVAQGALGVLGVIGGLFTGNLDLASRSVDMITDDPKSSAKNSGKGVTPPPPPPSPSPGPSNTGSSSKKVSNTTIEELPGSGLSEKLTDVTEAMENAQKQPSGNRTQTLQKDSLVQRGRKDADKQDVDVAIKPDKVVQNVEEPEEPKDRPGSP